MITVAVDTSPGYDIHIGSGLLSGVGERISACLPRAKTVAVITDDTVRALHLEPVMQSLTRVGLGPCSFVIPPGEASKNGAMYLDILNWLADAKLTRADCVLALGGGVVADLAGFVAATYQRGLPHILLPTTLPAMIASSAGGKTGIDLPSGKPLAGMVHPPALVVADTDTLKTLPEPVFAAGLAELIKLGVVA